MLNRIKVLALILLIASASPVLGAEWRWHAAFNENSSPELKELHAALYAVGTLATVKGVAVQDVTWQAESFSLHLSAGTIYEEPAIDGDVVGAFFIGQGEITFAPQTKKAISDLKRYFNTESLEKMPIESAYFFTLLGRSLVQELGIEGNPDVPFEANEILKKHKRALRQQGTSLTHAFLNRAGHAQGTAYVLVCPPSIRNSGSPEALLLFARDPQRQHELRLNVFGHEDAIRSPSGKRFLERYPDYQYQFWPVTALHSTEISFEPHGDVETYSTRLNISKGVRNTEETTTITVLPNEGVSALRFSLTSRLQVSRVTGPGGEAWPFLQWQDLNTYPNIDQNLLVWTGDPLRTDEPIDIVIESSGLLFDVQYGAVLLADEDSWYPGLDDREGAIFELQMALPKRMRAVGAGKLVSEGVAEGRRSYHFLTSYPAAGSTFYVGNFERHEAKADETLVELHASSARDELTAAADLPGISVDVFTLESPKYTVTEVSNAVSVYNRLLGNPLELETLRVVTTPTSHGRGFEGLILLSSFGGTSSDQSAGDIFRAHEVAHQWWGNLLDTEDWPEDRWLSEAFSEYCAMEYYDVRFQKPEKTQKQRRELWWQPIFMTTESSFETLNGEHGQANSEILSPLIAGGQNVYTKGPLVLHMLRYLFQIQKKNDDAFWEMLGDFIGRYKFQRVNTADFIKVAEQHMEGRLDWFWDQWIYGTEIPTVRWSHEIKQDGEGWLVVVDAEQEETDFTIPIPIYIHMKGGKTLTTPLAMRGKQGRAQAKLREKPLKVTLNDNCEALVELKKK